jgi:hypothetical protein
MRFTSTRILARTDSHTAQSIVTLRLSTSTRSRAAHWGHTSQAAVGGRMVVAPGTAEALGPHAAIADPPENGQMAPPAGVGHPVGLGERAATAAARRAGARARNGEDAVATLGQRRLADADIGNSAGSRSGDVLPCRTSVPNHWRVTVRFCTISARCAIPTSRGTRGKSWRTVF